MVSVTLSLPPPEPVLFKLEDKRWYRNGNEIPKLDAYYLVVTSEVTVWHHYRQWARGVYNIVAGIESIQRYMADVDGLETLCICQEILRCPEKWKDLPTAGPS